MSYRLIEGLKNVRGEYEAAHAAMAYVLQGWARLHTEQAMSGQTLTALRSAVSNLEATYTARLFAEFEAILRAQYPHSRPKRSIPRNSDGLINGLGSHYKVQPDDLQKVGKVREFRHSVAHADPGAEPVPFVDALSWLCVYLNYISDQDVPKR